MVGGGSGRPKRRDRITGAGTDRHWRPAIDWATAARVPAGPGTTTCKTRRVPVPFTVMNRNRFRQWSFHA